MNIMTMQQTNIFVNANDGFNFYPTSKTDGNEAYTETEVENISMGKGTIANKAATDYPIKRKANCWVEDGPKEKEDLPSPDFKQRNPSMRL